MSVTSMTVNFDTDFHEPSGIEELNLSELELVNGGIIGVFIFGLAIGIALAYTL